MRVGATWIKPSVIGSCARNVSYTMVGYLALQKRNTGKEILRGGKMVSGDYRKRFSTVQEEMRLPMQRMELREQCL